MVTAVLYVPVALLTGEDRRGEDMGNEALPACCEGRCVDRGSAGASVRPAAGMQARGPCLQLTDVHTHTTCLCNRSFLRQL